MTTPTTPEQARDLANDFENIDHWHLTGVKLQHGAEILRSLAQQVEALTADLAAEKLFSKQAMDSVTEIAAQRDALTKERDEWKSKHFAFKDCDDMRNDAELYRHLRDHFAKNLENAREEFARLEPLTGAQFDAAVRASMDLMGAAS